MEDESFGPDKPYNFNAGIKSDPAGFLKEMDSIPLFMNSLDPDTDYDENPTLAALQALKYDGTPEENAKDFKDQGNECFQAGSHKYKDAIQFYTDGIEQKCKDNELNSILHSNRAAVNLELGNFGKVLRDCAKAIEYNPKNIKAYYRSGKACYILEKIPEALDCCDRALNLDPKNKGVKDLKAKILRRKHELDEKEKRRLQKIAEEEKEKQLLTQTIKDRKINIVTNNEFLKKYPVQKENAVRLDKETKELLWPVFFLYPEYKESDFISGFNENNTFEEHLEVMFGDPNNPAPWDKDHVYTPDNLNVYFETYSKNGEKTRLLKVPNKMKLKTVLSNSKYTLIDMIPAFIILPKNSKFSEEFIDNFLKKD